MDIGLPGLNGIEATTEILRHCPETKIVILSMYDDEHSVVSAIRSGARAFVLKKASDNDLARRAANGRQGRIVSESSGLRPAAAPHSARRSGIEASSFRARRVVAARTAGVAAGGRRQDQQGDRGDARSWACRRCAAIARR